MFIKPFNQKECEKAARGSSVHGQEMGHRLRSRDFNQPFVDLIRGSGETAIIGVRTGAGGYQEVRVDREATVALFVPLLTFIGNNTDNQVFAPQWNGIKTNIEQKAGQSQAAVDGRKNLGKIVFEALLGGHSMNISGMDINLSKVFAPIVHGGMLRFFGMMGEIASKDIVAAIAQNRLSNATQQRV